MLCSLVQMITAENVGWTEMGVAMALTMVPTILEMTGGVAEMNGS